MAQTAWFSAALEGGYILLSGITVGASLITESGIIYKGANVENASYGGAICAERCAIVKAVSEGHHKFAALVVTSDLQSPVPCCGMCLQVIREFFSLDTPIYLIPSSWTSESVVKTLAEYKLGKGGIDSYVVTCLNELLPFSFGPDDLEKPRQ